MTLAFWITGVVLLGLLYWYYHRFRSLKEVYRKIEIRSFAWNALSIVLIFIFNILFFRGVYPYQQFRFFIILNLFLLMVFLIVSILNLNTYENTGKAYNNLELNRYYNQLLQNFVDELRRIKHNYNNILAVISGYVRLKKWDKLTGYLRELDNDFKEVNQLNPIIFGKISNIALLVTFMESIKKASTMGIKIEVDCEPLISQVNANMYVLCDIIGKVLEGEILNLSAKGEKKIPVRITEKEKNLYFEFRTTLRHDFFEKLEEIARKEKWLKLNTRVLQEGMFFELVVKDGLVVKIS